MPHPEAYRGKLGQWGTIALGAAANGFFTCTFVPLADGLPLGKSARSINFNHSELDRMGKFRNGMQGKSMEKWC